MRAGGRRALLTLGARSARGLEPPAGRFDLIVALARRLRQAIILRCKTVASRARRRSIRANLFAVARRRAHKSGRACHLSCKLVRPGAASEPR